MAGSKRRKGPTFSMVNEVLEKQKAVQSKDKKQDRVNKNKKKKDKKKKDKKKNNVNINNNNKLDEIKNKESNITVRIDIKKTDNSQQEKAKKIKKQMPETQVETTTTDQIIEKIVEERKEFKNNIKKAAEQTTQEQSVDGRVEWHYKMLESIENDLKRKDMYTEVVLNTLLSVKEIQDGEFER